MQSTSAPAEPTVTDSSHDQAHKTGFLDLPQELRDHIYSLLCPRLSIKRGRDQVGLRHERFHDKWENFITISLTGVCHTIRQDVLRAFWSSRPVLASCRVLMEDMTRDRSEDYLRYIKHLRLRAANNFAVDGEYVAVMFGVSEKDDGFHVLLEREPNTGVMRLGGCQHYTSEEREMIAENIQVKAQPYMKKAEQVLNERGCITLEAIRIIAEIHEPISYWGNGEAVVHGRDALR
ncbi:hypothetical protein PRZ48_011899 [Zasmidium cellare]|uniref:Uncharacterized protein n=1 Tax=Zasmidium cellare TaxID=395010 RepID=A0ABR0E7M9_ZASCE|nr:hypothetical protein PRZ48_011899 [Zasmidium cellare]